MKDHHRYITNSCVWSTVESPISWSQVWRCSWLRTLAVHHVHGGSCFSGCWLNAVRYRRISIL